MAMYNNSNWDQFDRLISEASKLSLLDDLEQENYRKECISDTASIDESKCPRLSRNSTVSSTSTASSSLYRRTLSISSNVSRNSSLDYHRWQSPYKDLSSPPLTPKSLNSYYQVPTKDPCLIEPAGCFIPCKRETFSAGSYERFHHFVVPVYAMTGESHTNTIQLLFNYTNTCATYQGDEKSLTWSIDQNQSLITLIQYVYEPAMVIAQPYLSDNVRKRLGLTSTLVIVPSNTMHSLYTLLDNLSQSIEQTHTSSCSWWSRVILVIDQKRLQSDNSVYAERKLFLAHEMPNIMRRYNLQDPLSVLFISASTLQDVTNIAQREQYRLHCQRTLWHMIERHSRCNRYTTLNIPRDTEEQGDDDDDDASSCSSDEAYAFATVIHYENGVRKKPQKTYAQRFSYQTQKPNSYHDSD
ncbi:hypothetical protein CU097_001771 [Rhizopus azygosporus]|uniref:Uncharacterized protein n=1 Tax=Rhizopus azygosporus TaxID=86630 RepID=A0A367JAK5_RHIAZ|nr:hypothetical protein CU097_001771 [Rhizopus azygosporus]